MRRSLVVAALTAALSVPTSAASADSTVVVPGLAFPSSDTYLTWFGCEDLYHADTRGPQLRIGGMGDAPVGRRSFGLELPGTGTAAGPVHRVESVAGTSVAGFAARADRGGAGVAYVWYVAPGLQPGETWAGRADLRTGSSWSFADTRAVPYTWTRYDAASGSVLEDGGSHTVAEFTDLHGDGPGYLLAGFGCDGEPFQLDGLRYGSPGAVTTYDLEGISVSAAIRASHRVVPATGQVTLTGTAHDAAGVPSGSVMVLEARVAGEQEFRPVGDPVAAGPGGAAEVVVRPVVTTEYRWFLPGSGFTDPGYSPVTKVLVRRGPR